jgi:hypothetical protein
MNRGEGELAGCPRLDNKGPITEAQLRRGAGRTHPLKSARNMLRYAVRLQIDANPPRE